MVNQNEHSELEQEEIGFTYSLKEGIFILVMSVLNFLIIRIFSNGGGGVYVSVYIILLCASIYVYVKQNKIKTTKKHWILLAYIIGLGCSYSVFENYAINFFTTIFLTISISYWILMLVGEKNKKSNSNRMIKDVAQGFKNCFKNEKKRNKISKLKGNTPIQSVIIGVLIATPVLIFVIAQLTIADEGFASLIKSFFGNIEEYIILLILGILTALGMFQFMIKNKNPKQEETKKKLQKSTSPITYITVMIMFIIIYDIFLISAGMSFFKFMNGTHEAYVLSNYARTGFFQLLIVSLVNVLLFIIVRKKVVSTEAIKICLSIIGVETLGLLILALAKMYLYVDAHSLTFLRFHTTFFMLVLFLCISVVLIGLWKKINYSRICTGIVMCSYLILCYSNSARIIVDQNVKSYTFEKDEQIDLYVFTKANVSGVKGAATLYNKTNNAWSKDDLKTYLLDMREELQVPNHENIERMGLIKIIDETLQKEL